MRRLSLLMLLATAIACGSGEVEPAQTPAVTATVADAPAADAPAADAPVVAAAPDGAHHCRVTPAFNCKVAGGKVLSVCEMETGLSYRYGAIGEIEKQYPPPNTESHFEYSAVTTISAQGHSLSFTPGTHSFEVSEMVGAGGPNAEANNFAGVIVSKGDEVVSTIACIGAVESDWETLERMAQFDFSDMGAP